MASKSGQRTDPLIADLVGEPYRFSFFQAMRILEKFVSRSQNAQANQNIEVDAILVRPNTSLAFPTADIHEIEFMPPLDVDDETERFRITVNFLGLYGVDSPLPDFYLDDFVQNDDDDNPRRAFLDVFHQRLYWLLFRCWRKYRFDIVYETDAGDDFSQRMFALIGLADRRMRERLTFAPQRLFGFSGALSRREISASAMQTVLAKTLQAPVVIEQFISRWAEIPLSQRLQLGTRNSRLGRDTTLGERVCDIGSKFRVRIGPLTWSDYQTFLPGGQKRIALDALIDHVLGRPLAYDIALALAPTPRSRFALGGGLRCDLGLSSWLAAREKTVSTVIFEGKN